MKATLAEVQAQLKLLQEQNLEQKIRTSVETAVREQSEQERCRKALVISGVDETEDADRLKVEEILAEVGVDSDQICGLYRIGDPPTQPENDEQQPSKSRPRLLKVKLWSGHWRNEALRNSKNLKSREGFNGIYVNPSRTFAERQKIKKLGQDLDEKV